MPVQLLTPQQKCCPLKMTLSKFLYSTEAQTKAALGFCIIFHKNMETGLTCLASLKPGRPPHTLLANCDTPVVTSSNIFPSFTYVDQSIGN